MKKRLFNQKWYIDKNEESFIGEEELKKLKENINNLLEVKKCNICKIEKIIYYFKVNDKKDEYLDICLDCYKETQNKTCHRCMESKSLLCFYTIRNNGYTDLCKKCIQEELIKNKNKKICKKCNRELPANQNYFKVQGHYKDYLENNCRVCRGLKYLK